MRSSTLNLLQHPHSPIAKWRQHAAWGLGGFALAPLLGTGMQSQHSQWSVELAQARQHRAQQEAADKRQRATRETVQKQRQQQAELLAVQAQQGRVLALQMALAHETAKELHLTRWQADGQYLQLQGTVVRAEAVSDLQARLEQALGQPWSLLELTAGPAGTGLSWSLQTPWPPASAPKEGA